MCGSNNRKWAAAMFGSLASLGLVGCGGTPSIEPGYAQTQADPRLGQQGFVSTDPADYVILPNDVISVNVFREPDLSVERVVVNADGLISLPLVGTLQVGGQTAQQVQSDIRQLLNARYLRDANVAVNMVEYASHLVTVEGSVESPGLYPFPPGARLSGSIALADGFARVAKREEVAIFRYTPDGIQIAKFDYGAVQSGAMLDPLIQPGDRVIVGTNHLSQFWQDLLKALPAFALFTNVGI